MVPFVLFEGLFHYMYSRNNCGYSNRKLLDNRLGLPTQESLFWNWSIYRIPYQIIITQVYLNFGWTKTWPSSVSLRVILSAYLYFILLLRMYVKGQRPIPEKKGLKFDTFTVFTVIIYFSSITDILQSTYPKKYAKNANLLFYVKVNRIIVSYKYHLSYHALGTSFYNR